MWPRSLLFIPVNSLILSSREPLVCVCVCVKDGVMGIKNQEEKCVSFFLAAFRAGRVPNRDSSAEPRPVALKSASDCSEEKADHKYARLRPAGSRTTALLPCQAATVGGGVILFSIPLPFPAALRRKETCCRCLGKVSAPKRTENPADSGSSSLCFGKFRPRKPDSFNQDRLVH